MRDFIETSIDYIKNIPIVFLTAKTDSISKNLGTIIGKDYINKPFDIIDLKKRIDRILK